MLGLRFRRQAVLHGFFVDFYCPALRLVLEVDGSGHQSSSQQSYDITRTAWLTGHGYRVVRVRNQDVTRTHIESLLRRLIRTQSLRSPSPVSGEGVRG